MEQQQPLGNAIDLPPTFFSASNQVLRLELIRLSAKFRELQDQVNATAQTMRVQQPPLPQQTREQMRETYEGFIDSGNDALMARYNTMHAECKVLRLQLHLQQRIGCIVGCLFAFVMIIGFSILFQWKSSC